MHFLSYTLKLFYHIFWLICHSLHLFARSTAEEKAIDATYFSSLNEMLPHCDFVMILVNLTPETTHIMGAQQFKLMKKTAILANCSRGKPTNMSWIRGFTQCDVIRVWIMWKVEVCFFYVTKPRTKTMSVLHIQIISNRFLAMLISFHFVTLL